MDCGDRVIVEATFGCGKCEKCRLGYYRFCEFKRGYGGRVTCDEPPYLWGAYGQYLYLPPTAKVHKVGDALSAEVAVLVSAVLGNGVRWLRTEGGVTIGDTAVIVGPGPQGLAATVAAKESGAKNIIVVGLAKDEARLNMASNLGATHTIAHDKNDAREIVTELSNGQMADVVIDVTNSTASPALSLDLVKIMGTLVLAGGASGKPTELTTNKITGKEITVKGVNTHDSTAVKQALSIAESGRYPLDQIVSHRFPLEEAEQAILMLENTIPTDNLVKIVLYPNP